MGREKIMKRGMPSGIVLHVVWGRGEECRDTQLGA